MKKIMIFMVLMGFLFLTNVSFAMSPKDQLCQAAEKGDFSKVQQLLKTKINVDAVCNEFANDTALYQAAQNGHDKIVALLINAGANPNIKYFMTQNTPLHAAVSIGHHRVVLELLKSKKININAINSKFSRSSTPLKYAVLRNHRKIVEELVNAGADPNIADSNGFTPLMWAIRKEGVDVKIVEHLLSSKNIDLNKPNPKQKNLTALHYAASKGNERVLELLINKGAKPIKDSGGNYPQASSESVKLFLEKKLKETTKVSEKSFGSLLVEAIKQGKLEKVKKMIKQFASKKNYNEILGNTVELAGIFGQIDILRFFIKKIPQENRVMLVEEAVEKGLLKQTKQLIEVAFEDVEEHLGDFVIFAAQRGHLDILRFLIDKSAKLKLKKGKPNALHVVTNYKPKNKFEIVKLLVQHGISPDAGGYIYFPLTLAYDDIDLMELLLEKGANPSVSAKPRDEGNLINYARKEKKIDIVKLLEEAQKKYDLGAQLFKAIGNNDLAKVNQLISKGANLNVRGKPRGYSIDTPLTYAITEKKTGIAKALIKKGADVMIPGFFKRTPLQIAIKYTDLNFVKFFIDQVKDKVNLKDFINQSLCSAMHLEGPPLHYAIETGKLAMVKLLVENGARVNQKNNDDVGGTPLHSAVEGGQEKIISFLVAEALKKGISLNSFVDEDGETPLHYAVGDGKKEIVELLIKHGADPKVADKYGKTPLSEAQKKGNAEIIKILSPAVKIEKKPSTKEIDQLKNVLEQLKRKLTELVGMLSKLGGTAT